MPHLDSKPSRIAILVFNILGILSQALVFTEEAIRHFYTALRHARAFNISNRVAQVTANLGEIFYVSGNAEDAETLLLEARDIAKTSSERWLAPFISTMLALCMVSLNKHEEAYQTIAEYIDDIEADESLDKANRAFCLSVAAYTLAMRGQLAQADKLSNTAVQMLDQFEDTHLKPYTWWVCGHLHRRHERYDDAIIHLRKAVEDIGGYIYMPLRAMKELSEIFAEIGDWEQAFGEQTRYLNLFAKAQGQASRVHVQTLHIRNELREAELARTMAEEAIAERKQLDDELKRMLSERETILENSIVGMVFLNNQGRVQWVNSPLCQIFGVDRETVLGSSLEPFYPTRELYLESGAHVSEAVMRGVAYESELRMRRSDGSLFWVHFSGRAVDKNNLSHGTVWVVMDISARRQLEEDLYKSEQHYRQLINNVTEGILVVQGGGIVFANPRVERLTGYSVAELKQIPFMTAIYPDDRAMVMDHHARRLQGEDVEQYYQFRIENSQTKAIHWLELSAVLIDWEGAPATLSFVSDVTQRKILEAKLKDSMAEQIRLQTLQMQAELKESELARLHAEETTEAKSMFLANMSQEIRTPMNAIIGMAHLALRTELNPKQKDYVEKIHKAGISLLGIINDILDFSKIEAGKLDIEQVDFNLDDVLNNISAVTSDKAYEKGLEYLFRAPSRIPRHLVGDPLRLGQVLINLINNAIKFTEHGEICVNCEQVESQGGRIKLKFMVSDTGIGMTEAQSAKLFRAFSQADESTTRKFGGTGLGLSISKGMVELMGGDIGLRSESGKGTSVYFTAWFGLAANAEERLVLPNAINGMRLLVVDDNPAAADILKEMLSALQVEVDQVYSGAAALAAVCANDSQHPYDIVFADLHMPEMDGLELTTYLKRDESLSLEPLVVLVSNHGYDEFNHREDVASPDGFLTKPVNASTLIDCLIELVSSSKAPASANHGVVVPHFSDLRVLLVEDNEINQQIAVELMEASGIKVDVAGNGRLAINALMAVNVNYYDIVFMDVQMPEMDGHEATKIIRKDPHFNNLPVVAMTAHAMVEEKERCFASGMDAHLAKPINPKELYNAISHWCPGKVMLSPPVIQATREDLAEKFDIEGLNVEEGLNRTLGNRAFYFELLTRFCDDQRGAIQKIREVYATDVVHAERLAHTLKGVAGLIGAKDIQALAELLETRLHKKVEITELDTLLIESEDKLNIVINAIQTKISHDAEQQTIHTAMQEVSQIDRESIQAILERCSQLLRDYDSEAVDFILDSSGALSSALGTDAYKLIMRSMRQFDFDTALSALESGAASNAYSLT